MNDNGDGYKDIDKFNKDSKDIAALIGNEDVDTVIDKMYNLNEELISYIIKSGRAFDFVNRSSLAFEDIPKELIDAVSKSSYHSYIIIEKLSSMAIKYSCLPLCLLKAISTNVYYSYLYAEILKFDKRRVPDFICDSIALNGEYSYAFAKANGFISDQIPKNILESASAYDKLYKPGAQDIIEIDGVKYKKVEYE